MTSNATAFCPSGLFKMCIAMAMVFGSMLIPAASSTEVQCDPSVRTYDGSCNNLNDPMRGATGKPFAINEGVDYVDGIGIPRTDLPNIRNISNLLVSDDIPDFAPYDATRSAEYDYNARKYNTNPDLHHRLNMLSVIFGQFVDHDLAMTNLVFAGEGMPSNFRTFVESPDDMLYQYIAEVEGACENYFFPPLHTTTTEDTVAGTKTLSVTEPGHTVLRTVGDDFEFIDTPFSFTTKSSLVTTRMMLFTRFAERGELPSGVMSPLNLQTSYLDLSVLYGPTDSVTTKLRKNDGSGALLTAPDGELPFLEQTADENGVALENECIMSTSNIDPLSASGDPRTDENLILTAIHSMYFKNHNYLASVVQTKLADQLAGLSLQEQDNLIFERARALNIATFQRNVFYEYLPVTFGRHAVASIMGDYHGYDSNVDATSTTAFSIASRIGHDQVNLPLLVPTETCELQPIPVILGFPLGERGNCNYEAFRQATARQILLGSIDQFAQKIDGKVVDLMRNMVFKVGCGQGTAPGNLDIETANIFRGREVGLLNYDDLRKFYLGTSVYDTGYGCEKQYDANGERMDDPVECFEVITGVYGPRANATRAQALKDVYGTVDTVDAFIGMLSEQPEGANDVMGPLATTIILEQFKKMRDGDRWYFENTDNSYLNFDAEELDLIDKSISELLEQHYGIFVDGRDHGRWDSKAFRVPREPLCPNAV